MKLEGKAAVVTGGAKGMGRAICLALAGEGAAVAVNYATSQAEAEEVVRAIAANGGQAMAVRADVGKDAEARQLIETAAQCFGRLDILVNNAGYTQRVPHRELDLLTDALMDRVLAVNTKGPLYCSRAAIPHMQRQGAGFIVNITSVAATMGHGSSIIYGASKAALTTITKSLARAFAPEIRVNAVAPGYVDTGFGSWPPGTAERAAQAGHIGRIVTVEDVAAVTLFLVTDGAMLTGEEIVLDGGLLALGPRS